MSRTFLVPFIVLTLLTLLVLSGCAGRSRVEYQIVEQTTYVHIPIGETLTSPIVPKPPPKKETYVEASFEERTVLLTDYVADLLKVTKDLNNRLIQIHNLDKKNETMIEEYNQKEKERVQELVGNTIKALKQEK